MSRRPGRALPAIAMTIGMILTSAAPASDAELARAGQLIQDGKYQEAFDLLAPLEAQNQGDAAFNALLGQAALHSNRPDLAVTFFERGLELSPGSIDAHLGLARAYLALGNYARAKIEFETVLRIDNLPADLHQQVEIYAAAARNYAAGRRLLPYGYAILGFGNYRVNPTSGTDEFGGSDTDDNFFHVRGGGGLSYILNDDYALDGSLDYRYRNYGNEDRRDDKDLRWNVDVSRSFGNNNLAIGSRGRNSYRGNGDSRKDYGIYGNWRFVANPDDQFSLGAEFRRRTYSRDSVRERSHDTAELTGDWTHVLPEGKASFTLTASGGREFARNDRPDGDSVFYGLSPSVDFALTETLGGFIFGWWQHESYKDETFNVDAEGNILGIEKRRDNLYEAGGGLTWLFAKSWTLNPEILYIRDKSNILSINYSSTEVWVTVRKDF